MFNVVTVLLQDRNHMAIDVAWLQELVAPMAAVFVLDGTVPIPYASTLAADDPARAETCARYYLLFAPNLKSLLVAWGIGKRCVLLICSVGFAMT